jgi:hypothetical protein
MVDTKHDVVEGFTPAVVISDDENEQALYELEQERVELEEKIKSGEYKVIEGKVYNVYGECLGYYR